MTFPLRLNCTPTPVATFSPAVNAITLLFGLSPSASVAVTRIDILVPGSQESISVCWAEPAVEERVNSLVFTEPIGKFNAVVPAVQPIGVSLICVVPLMCSWEITIVPVLSLSETDEIGSFIDRELLLAIAPPVATSCSW